jgi:predicted nuclease of predicted toxin-antitoxin system
VPNTPTEFAPSSDDDEILRQANRQSALFLTSDKDFGELVYRQRRVHGGVVLIRLLGLSASVKADVAAHLLRERGAEMAGAFTVVSPGMVRIRRTP